MGRVLLTDTDRTDRSERLAALMQRVGFAIWQLQELETTVAAYLVIRVHAQPGIGVERGSALFTAAEGRTLGSLLTELAKSGGIEKELALKLRGVLEERNWLVHRGRRENRGMLANAKQYDSLVERLDALSDQSLELLKSLAADVERYVVDTGVSCDVIDAEADRLARSWGMLD
jgi:hypothetical protein